MDLAEELIAAVFSKDAKHVESILKKGPDINVNDYNGLTPLMIAVRFGQVEIIKKLLEAGADPNVPIRKVKEEGWISRDDDDLDDDDFIDPESGATAIFLAVDGIAPHIEEMAKALIDGGADPNIKADDGTTILHRVVMTSGRIYPEIIRFALEAGADTSITDRYGKTACALAEERLRELGNETPIEQALLDQMKELTASLPNSILGQVDEHAEHIFDNQSINNKRNALQTILELLGGDRQTALASTREEDTTIDLIDTLLTLDLPRSERPKPINSIYNAADAGDLELVKLFVENGANVTKRAPGGTVMGFALKGGNPEVIRYLLQQGAKLDQVDVMFIDTDIDEDLYYDVCDASGIDRATATEARKKAATTSLPFKAFGVAAKGAMAVMDLITQDSAVPLSAQEHQTVCKRTIAQIRAGELDEVINDEIKIDIEGRSPLGLAAVNGLEALVDALLERGASPNGAESEKKSPPIAEAARYGHRSIVQKLLQAGASVEGDAKSALRYAAEFGDIELVQLLADAGMDPRDKYMPAVGAASGPYAKQMKKILKAAAKKMELSKKAPALAFKTTKNMPTMLGAKDFLDAIGEIGNGEYCIVLIRSKGQAVEQSFSKLFPDAKVTSDVITNRLDDAENAVIGIQLKDSDWTILPFCVGFQDWDRSKELHEATRKFSDELSASAVWFFEEDTSCVPTIALFEKGELIEEKSFEFEEDEEAKDEEVYYCPKLQSFFSERSAYIPVGYYDSDGHSLKFTLVGINKQDVAYSFGVTFEQ